MMPQRSVQAEDCSKCRFKCNIHYNEVKTKAIFSNYWSLKCYERQQDFIRLHEREVEPKRTVKAANRWRTATRQYYLDNSMNQQGCKEFFSSTLDIKNKVIEVALKKKQRFHNLVDHWGRYSPSNTTEHQKMAKSHLHIESFPKVSAHYAWKDTTKDFLEADLNISKMHELFEAKCKQEGVKPMSARVYRKVFDEFNLSFHKPKKDQCLQCEVYRNP